MARFDVYSLSGFGYVLDCQADLLDYLDTRFVVPLLVPNEVPAPLPALNPRFDVEGEQRLMATHLAASVQKRSLGKSIQTLRNEQDAIMRALDMLIVGF